VEGRAEGGSSGSRLVCGGRWSPGRPAGEASAPERQGALQEVTKQLKPRVDVQRRFLFFRLVVGSIKDPDSVVTTERERQMWQRKRGGSTAPQASARCPRSPSTHGGYCCKCWSGLNIRAGSGRSRDSGRPPPGPAALADVATLRITPGHHEGVDLVGGARRPRAAGAPPVIGGTDTAGGCRSPTRRMCGPRGCQTSGPRQVT